MAGVSLYDYQVEALKKMKNGCILCGGVGSGKSRTSLAYYYTRFGGEVNTENYIRMTSPKDLYIITTARKRDTREWESELSVYYMYPESSAYSNKVVIDSWNNIKKYSEVKNAFFIFDEQRVVGYGAWTKSFLKIAKSNQWILLSATPGDTWMDYIPVFVANGFYKNKTEFIREHVRYSRFTKFPKVEGYMHQGKLVKYRNDILVGMAFQRETIQKHIQVPVEYNQIIYKDVIRDRWNIFEQKPIKNASEFCSILRKIINSDESRIEKILNIVKEHPKSIIFYNFDYELDILKSADYRDSYGRKIPVAEWNGHMHEPIPDNDTWIYLVQYTSGCEGWNCTSTDTIIFYSQSYSYRVMIQASGRIDRLNTPYKELYYYHLKSKSSLDISITRALNNKKNFNESAFALK